MADTSQDSRYPRRFSSAPTTFPTCWAAQAQQPNWLGIGATSHLFTEISTHTRDTACAGCIHTLDEVGDEPIPTVSVVSFWAGLLLAAEVVNPVARGHKHSRHTMSYPLGMGGRSGLVRPQAIRHRSARLAAPRDRAERAFDAA